MEVDESTGKISGFDQKAFLQIRLHELLARIDRLNANPLLLNPLTDSYNYKIIYQDLKSVFQTIFSKLQENEKLKGEIAISCLDNFTKEDIFPLTLNLSGKKVKKFNEKGWEKIDKGLLAFRCILEEMMDKHGFNPSKEDLSKAIIRM